MVVDVIDVGRSHVKIAVAFVDGDFHVPRYIAITF